MSAFGGRADITATERNFNLRLPQKLRQLGDIRRDPSRLIAREERRSRNHLLAFLCVEMHHQTDDLRIKRLKLGPLLRR
jgi:hypothetical protein